MLSTIRDIKGAFIALAPRSNGVPLGRTAYQDFEIAYFLNLAYNKLLKQRVEALLNMSNTIFTGGEVETPRRDLPYTTILSDLGTLYRSSVHLDDLMPGELPDFRKNLLWDAAMTKMFVVVPVNGFLPYIIGCDLFETFSSPSKPKTRVSEAIDAKQYSITYPVRILNETEILKYSLLLQRNPTVLPYRVGRIRADQQYSYLQSISTVTEYLDSVLQSIASSGDPMNAFVDESKFRRQMYILELLHVPIDAKAEVSCSIQYVVHPEPITEKEISNENDRFIEVGFGFEIAEMAAAMAAGNLGGGAGGGGIGALPMTPPQHE